MSSLPIVNIYSSNVPFAPIKCSTNYTRKCFSIFHLPIQKLLNLLLSLITKPKVSVFFFVLHLAFSFNYLCRVLWWFSFLYIAFDWCAHHFQFLSRAGFMISSALRWSVPFSTVCSSVALPRAYYSLRGQVCSYVQREKSKHARLSWTQAQILSHT